MTDRDGEATDAPEEERPKNTEEAAEIVRNDPALSKATEHSPQSQASSPDGD